MASAFADDLDVHAIHQQVAHIAGQRNREVYEYLELTHDVRDSRAAAIYSA
jgi:hypothetical protein